jgi:DNA recombination protein RmuC
MDLAALSIGIVVGLVLGIGIGAVLRRTSLQDAEAIAENLSAKVVGKQAEHILRLAETKLTGKKELIDGALKHMKEDLDKVERLMRDIGDKNTKVDARLEGAAKVIRELTDTAGSLKNALTSNSNRMAEDVLRLSWLIEGINYVKQKKLETVDSKPDFTFLLPQDLKLNMDVKFPFNNYQLYTEAKTDKEREEYRKKFLADVKNRIKEIRSREYINPEENTVDYVLLFIPNEQVFTFINETDRSLIDEAMKGKTILCSPLSLYAILAVIRQSIDSFRLESRSREMLSLFGTFKLQWEKFKEQMETVKARFETVQKGYDELTGARERQLDRQLTKIEELRADQGGIEEAFEKISEQQIAASATNKIQETRYKK